jgi:hypothetical protein
MESIVSKRVKKNQKVVYNNGVPTVHHANDLKIGENPMNTEQPVVQQPQVQPNQAVDQQTQVQPNQPVVQQNPLLAKIVPGETFTLPSLGIFYKNGELSDDVVNGEIYLDPFKTRHDILMRSPDKLFSGEAVNEVLKECCPQILKPLDLLSNDVDFILTALRKISFGNQTEISYTHDCEKATNHSYVLDIYKFITSAKTIDPTSVKSKYFHTLSNGQEVMFKPVKFGDSLDMYKNIIEKGDDMTIDEIESSIIKSVASLIESVAGINDSGMIIEWLSNLSPKMINELKDSTAQLNDWGANFTSTVKCKDCGEDVDITSEVNVVNFFLTD